MKQEVTLLLVTVAALKSASALKLKVFLWEESNNIYYVKYSSHIEFLFRICSKHRKEILAIPYLETVGPCTPSSNFTSRSEFTINDSRQSMNRILAEANLSPIRSQATKQIESYPESSLRRMKSKLNNAIQVIKSM